MKLSESAEHLAIKCTMARWLKEWFHGITIDELKMDGHEADVYGRTSAGVLIHVEVIWSPSCYRDNVEFLLTSDSNIKIAIFSPEAFEKYGAAYEKIELAKNRQGMCFFSDPLRGDLILANDPTYIESVHNQINKLISQITPPEVAPKYERTIMYLNHELIESTISKVKETEWDKCSIESKVLLLEEYYCNLPFVKGGSSLPPNPRGWPTSLSDFNFESSKKTIKLYGRFQLPYGIPEKETNVKIIWDPCYLNSGAIISEVHFLPGFIKSSQISGNSIGVDRWQNQNVFLVGTLHLLKPLQQPIIDPLVIYISKEEGTLLHKKLIDSKSFIESPEDAFEDIGEDFGYDKARKLEEMICEKYAQELESTCWSFIDNRSALWSTYDLIPKLISKTNQSDALAHVLYLIDEFDVKTAKDILTQFLEVATYTKTNYEPLIRQMLKALDPLLDFDELYTDYLTYCKMRIEIVDSPKTSTITKITPLPLSKVRGLKWAGESYVNVRGCIKVQGKTLHYLVQISTLRLKKFQLLITGVCENSVETTDQPMPHSFSEE
ncbi:MAG TPA: hypothetical protein VLU95_06680 [Candidatus Acidoferrum sp.]|nr:hypothetical protein [Candidatus Acidoferrum sp.]